MLSKRHGRWTAAQRAVGGVDLNGLAAILSRASFDVEQLHHDPGYENISWGGQGQLSEPIDLFDLYRALADRVPVAGAIRPAGSPSSGPLDARRLPSTAAG